MKVSIYESLKKYPATIFNTISNPSCVGFYKMHDCYLNYETRFTKLENLNKVGIDTGIEI